MSRTQFTHVSDGEIALGFEKRPKPTLRVMRESYGVSSEGEALRIALISMLAGYDQAINTLPAGSLARRMVEGAFGRAPLLARGLV